MIFLITASLLGACGGKDDSISGKYVKAKKSNLCQEYINFEDNNKFELKRSSWSSGEIATGKYEKLEDKNKYKFNFEDGSNEVFNLKFSKDKKDLKASKEGSETVCEFKADNS